MPRDPSCVGSPFRCTATSLMPLQHHYPSYLPPSPALAAAGAQVGPAGRHLPVHSLGAGDTRLHVSGLVVWCRLGCLVQSSEPGHSLASGCLLPRHACLPACKVTTPACPPLGQNYRRHGNEHGSKAHGLQVRIHRMSLRSGACVPAGVDKRCIGRFSSPAKHAFGQALLSPPLVFQYCAALTSSGS